MIGLFKIRDKIISNYSDVIFVCVYNFINFLIIKKSVLY